MSVTTTVTSTGTNYKDGYYNADYPDGSHYVGWDANKVRAEVFSFATGDWPVSHLYFELSSRVRQGSDIALRFAISTSKTAYVNASGPNVGYYLYDNRGTDIDINLSPNTTYYITVFPGIDRSEGWGLLGVGNPDDGNSFTLWMTEIDRTRCTPPTTLTLNKSIAVPGTSATLTWSGAKGGTNTTISGFEVLYRNTVSGEYATLGTTTNTYYTVTAPPQNARGSSYYFKVKTLSAQGSEYDSVESAASTGLKANTEPQPPTVSVNRDTVPSRGEGKRGVTFTVNPGSDPDNQTLTLAYSINNNPTKYKFTSPLTTGDITSNTTYYFYTYDGLEYSSRTYKTIHVNTLPTIENAQGTSVQTYTVQGGSGIEQYQYGYASGITPLVTVNKAGTITVGIEYYSSDDTSIQVWGRNKGLVDYNYRTIQEVTVDSPRTVNLGDYNIHQYINLGSTNIHWRVYYRINDGVEVSDWKYYPNGTDEQGPYYAIAHAPTLLDSNIFNQNNERHDISGTKHKEIWKEVTFKVPHDTSVPNTTATAEVTANGSTTPLPVSSVVTSTANNFRYISIYLPDGIASGAEVTITAQMKDTSNSITKSVTATVHETKIASIGNKLNSEFRMVKPFTASGKFTVTTAWPFGNHTVINSETLGDYNCSTVLNSSVKLRVYGDKSDSSSARLLQGWNTQRSGDYLIGEFNKNAVYYWDHRWGIDVYSGTHPFYYRLEIKNLFGKTITTDWIEGTLDFREPVQSPTISSDSDSIQYSFDGSVWNNFNPSTQKIQKGIYLKFKCNFGLYTTDEVKVTFSYKKNGMRYYISCYEEGSPQSLAKSITYSASSLNRASNMTVAQNTKEYVYYVNTEINDSFARDWCFIFTNTGSNASTDPAPETTKITNVTRQTKPNINLITCITNDDYDISYSFTMSDEGYDKSVQGNSLAYYLSDGTTDLTGAFNPTHEQGTTTYQGIVEATTTGWDVKTICIKTISTVGGLDPQNHPLVETYYSNAIIVYYATPTVAYRKNQLGINTNTPDSDAIVDIHQSTGRNVILIQGLDATDPSNPIPTKFKIDAATGKIEFYTVDTQNDTDILKYTIDLFNGILS